MDIAYGSEQAKKFITNVGLITSKGKHGQNIMACEWTHHISYTSGILAICVDRENETYHNIKKSKEFGVNLTALDQTKLASVAGGYSGSEYDKIEALKELGFEFYQAKKINTLMVKGASLNVECKVIKVIKLPEHTMFLGEAQEVSMNPDKNSVCFHRGLYWNLTNNVQKPSEEERAKTKEIVEKHKK